MYWPWCGWTKTSQFRWPTQRFSFKQNAFLPMRTAIVHTQHGGFITEIQRMSISPRTAHVNYCESPVAPFKCGGRILPTLNFVTALHNLLHWLSTTRKRVGGDYTTSAKTTLQRRPNPLQFKYPTPEWIRGRIEAESVNQDQKVKFSTTQNSRAGHLQLRILKWPTF